MASDPNKARIGLIGAGPGGISAGVHLRERGDDFVILEKAAGVGGTWWHNRYPGLACDLVSHLYSFSFEPVWDWSRPYATQAEIKAYLEHVVAKYGLADRIRFDVTVTAAHWDDDRRSWRLTTSTGDELEFDVVISGIGMFNELNWPDIPGLTEFAGTMFHSARWNRDHDLRGEHVGVIGSAASAVQFVPEVAKAAGRLTLYQRAANWVLPKEDTPYTDEQRAHFRAHPEEVMALRQQVFERIEPILTFSDPGVLELCTELGRQSIAVVEDPEVRRQLTPTVPYGCQRPLISNDYYPTFNRPNVELVTEAIDHITRDAIVTVDGIARRVDTIVAATGFQTTKFLSAIDVTGREGRDLEKLWVDGAHAYRGIVTSGFPNLFMLYGPNTNNGSIIYMIECQVEYIVRQLERMDREGIASMDVKAEVEEAYNVELQRHIGQVGVWAAGNCHNYYRGPGGHIVTQWPHSMSEYRRRTSEPDPDAFDVTYW